MLKLGEIKTCAHCIFCRKFNFEQLLIEAFFNIIVLLAAFSPKRIYFLISVNYFKNGKSLVPPSSIPVGDKDIRP